MALISIRDVQQLARPKMAAANTCKRLDVMLRMKRNRTMNIVRQSDAESPTRSCVTYDIFKSDDGATRLTRSSVAVTRRIPPIISIKEP